MSDTSTSKPGLVARIKAFLDELGADEAEGIEAGDEQEIEAATEDEARADEIDTAQVEETEAEVEGEPATEPGEGDGTPGAVEDGDAEQDDLRATITEQAATIETLRNTIAELGGVDPTEDAAPETEAEAAEDERTEDELVSDFDADYDRRQALLADMNKEK